MAWVATQNFRQVDRLLERNDPAAATRLQPLGSDARTVLRYAASEQNRWFFRNWEIVQLVSGALFFFAMLFGSAEKKLFLGGLLLLLALVAVQRFMLTPEIIALGRMIDFVPPYQSSPERSRFWVLHTAYSGVEVCKWVLTLVLTGYLAWSGQRAGRSRDARRELDGVDKSDYRRVNW
jgi:hypothetical protein